MKILALETTEQFGSVALRTETHGLAEIVLPKDRRSSQTLHPAIHALFETTQTAPAEIDIVAVVAGPGSFTGLRVGVTAAKVFAYTMGTKVIALDTFQVVASGTENTVPGSQMSIGVDAQRGEVIAAVLRRTEDGHIETVQGPELIPVADWWTHAEQYDNVLLTGPALGRWSTKVPSHIVLAPETDWFPKASVAGKLALLKKFDDVWSLQPIYSRPSAAEEKNQERWA